MIRVHELDEVLNATKEEVKAALKERGASTHHLTAVEDDDQVALLHKFGPRPGAPYRMGQLVEQGGELKRVVGFEEDAPVLSGLVLPEASDEEKEHPGTGVVSEPIEVPVDGSFVGLEADPIDPDLPVLTVADAALVESDDEDVEDVEPFPVYGMNGKVVGQELFDPTMTEKVKKALNGRNILSSRLDPKRGYLSVVTHPDMQKLRISCE